MKEIKAKTSRLNITDKTVMVSVDFHRIGNSRRLAVNQYHVDADKTMTRASKRLLKSEELKAISRFDGNVRSYIASKALPSMFKQGFWIVPNSLVEEVDAQLVAYSEQRKPLVDAFVAAYPGLMEKAKELLKGTFSESDYLSEADVRDQFTFSWRYVSFGVPVELEAIKEEVYKREQEKAVAHWDSATTEIQQMLRASMQDLVGHMNERLTPTEDGKAKIFKASTIDNINEFLTTFEARNVTDDKELAALVEKAKGLTHGLDAEKLRTDEELRKAMQIGMNNIKAELDTMVVLKPGRKIRYDDTEAEVAPKGAAEAVAELEVA